MRPAYSSLPSAFRPSLDGPGLLHERGEGVNRSREEEVRSAAAAGCAAAAATAGGGCEEGGFCGSDKREREGGREGVLVVWRQRGVGDGDDGRSHGLLVDKWREERERTYLDE